MAPPMPQSTDISRGRTTDIEQSLCNASRDVWWMEFGKRSEVSLLMRSEEERTAEVEAKYMCFPNAKTLIFTRARRDFPSL